MFKKYTTQLLESVLTFALIISFCCQVGAQCNPSNPLATGIMTNGITDFGQSFLIPGTCGNGAITDITVYSTSSNTEIKLYIYQGTGCTGTLIHEQDGITLNENGLPVPTTIDIIPDRAFTAGSTYTFRLELTGGGFFNLLKTDGLTDTYTSGEYFENCTAQTDEDLFFTVFTVAGIFPVELVDFNATNQGDQVQLRWSTASELNNAGFEVEHSTDTRQWETLAFVDGKGTTTEMTDYQYLDRNPAAGLNYYRLRQIDFDGEENYSPVKVVETLAGGTGLAIFPNPVMAGTELSLSGIAENVEAIWLTDLYGRPVWMGKSFEGGKTNIALPNDLSGGLYSLMVIAEGQKTVLKVVVQ